MGGLLLPGWAPLSGLSPGKYLQGKLAPQVEPGSHRSSKHLSPPCSDSDLPHLPVGKGQQTLKERRLLASSLHQNSDPTLSLKPPPAFSKLPISYCSLLCVPSPLPCLCHLNHSLPGLFVPWGSWCPQEAPDQKQSGVAGRFGGGGRA